MMISTSGLPTTGIFLDPTGDFQINHTGTISGWIIGGDTQNSSFVSGANLAVPAISTVPEPSLLAGLFGPGGMGLSAWFGGGE